MLEVVREAFQILKAAREAVAQAIKLQHKIRLNLARYAMKLNAMLHLSLAATTLHVLVAPKDASAAQFAGFPLTISLRFTSNEYNNCHFSSKILLVFIVI